jgi:alkylhydroperoxidase/carboxymuconolactone decarboxylase family protein YurZ
MVENAGELPDNLKQEHSKICAEIRKVLDGTKGIDALQMEGALSPRPKKLIALAAALALQREHGIVASCVADCLNAGVTREEIMEALRLAILMAEIPAETYTAIVREAIDAFEGLD